MIFRGEVACLKFSNSGTDYWALKKQTPQDPVCSFCYVHWD